MASDDRSSSSYNSLSREEIDRVLGSTYAFVKADHAGCDICGQLRDAGNLVLLKCSTEAMGEFWCARARYTEANDEFRIARKGFMIDSVDHRSVRLSRLASRYAFHWAAWMGHVVIALYLLGVDPEPDGEAKADALEMAAREGHSQVVEVLLDVLDVDPKVAVEAITGVQSNALCKAAANGHVGVVEVVLKHPKVKEFAPEYVCKFPLYEARRIGHTGVVKVLQKYLFDRVLGPTHAFVEADHAGCDICGQLRVAGNRVLKEASSEAIDDFLRARRSYHSSNLDSGFYYSDFLWAAKEGHTVIVQFILGVDPRPDGNAKGEALWLAAMGGHIVTVQFLLGDDPKPDGEAMGGALESAARVGHIDMVQFLLGVDPKPDGKAMGDALKSAARGGHIDIVQILLGVDPKPDGNAMEDALKLAVEEGHIDIVKFILGVDPKPDGKAMGDALKLAAEGGKTEIVKFLLNHPLLDEKATLRWAMMKGDNAFVEVLLKHPLLRTYTTLCLAVKEGDTAYVKVLLEYPSLDVNATHDKGLTLLHLAVKEGHIGVMEVLLKHPSIDVNARDDEGATPFHLAVALARLTVVDSDGVSVWHNKVLDDTYLENLRKAHLEDKSKESRERNYWKSMQLFAKHIDGCKLDQENNYSKNALEYAYESKDISIWQVLSQAERVKIYIEGLYKDRQVYVDAANAILVGAALIASVTFGSWLQPPLSYTFEGDGYPSPPSSPMPMYVDVEHNVAMRVFWVFNCFSFYFAMATVVAGACSVLPRRKLFIKKIVQKLRRYLIATSLLLGCSVLCVIVAFGISGSIVLAPMLKFQSVMIVPTIVGGLICLIWLVILLKNIVEDMELKDLQICLPRCFRKHK